MSICKWKPIQHYLYFDGFPVIENNMILPKLHRFLYTIFHFFPIEEIYQFMNKLFIIYSKRGLSIILYECENNLFVVKKKYVFDEFERTAMISILGINNLIDLTPNFIYTFYHQQYEKKYSLEIMEFIDGVPLDKFMKNLFMLNSKQNLEEHWQIFLSIVLQILLSLEIAQSKIFFTHYDLHLKNIIIKIQPKVDICYNTFHGSYCLTNVVYLPKIIDFEFSVVKPPSKYSDETCMICNVYTTTFPYGYYASFIPGIDMLRFLCCIRLICNSNESRLEKRIIRFLNKVFFEFYKMDSSMFEKKKFIKLSKTFFNFTDTSYVYYCPFELLDFLFKNFHLYTVCVRNYDSFIVCIQNNNNNDIPPPTHSVKLLKQYLHNYKNSTEPFLYRKKRIMECLSQLIHRKETYNI
jgi:hypothetical protein